MPRGGIEPPTQGFSVLLKKIYRKRNPIDMYVSEKNLVFMLVFIFCMRKMKDLTRL